MKKCWIISRDQRWHVTGGEKTVVTVTAQRLRWRWQKLLFTVTVTVMVTRKIFFGDGDGDKKIFFRWRWRLQKSFFRWQWRWEENFFRWGWRWIALVIPPLVWRILKKQGGYLDHLCRILFSEICWKKGGGRCQNILKKSFKFLSFFPIFWPKIALKFKKISPAAHLW